MRFSKKWSGVCNNLSHFYSSILATLIFFAALFILMDALSKLGLIDWIAQNMAALVFMVPEGGRVYAAVILILWVSSIASAFLKYVSLVPNIH